MSLLTLQPSQNEKEFADERLVGEWAAALPELLAKTQIAPWCTYVARRNGHVVGLGGYKSGPNNEGIVEISYLTLTPEQGRGTAKDICARLIAIAKDAGVDKFLAHTLPAENASTAVLLANGFKWVGAFNDPEDGAVWRWEFSLPPL